MELSFNPRDIRPQTKKIMRTIKTEVGDTLVRIAPPRSPTEPLYKTWTLHWGFMDPNGRLRPLSCCKKSKLDYCPICEEADKQYQVWKAIEKEFSYEVEGSTYAKVNYEALKECPDAETYAEAKEAWGNIRGKTKWYYNAFDRSGNHGLLSVPKSVYDGISDKLYEAYQTYDLDPVALEGGVWLKITRTGSGAYNTKYEVFLNKEIINHPEHGKLEKVDREELPKSSIASYGEDFYDLANMYKTLTAKDLQGILEGKDEPWDKLAKQEEAAPPSTNGVVKSASPKETDLTDDTDALRKQLFGEEA